MFCVFFLIGSWQCQLCNARITGTDILKAAVLPEHMDVVTVPQ